MIDREILLECIKEPMEKYHQAALNTMGNWEPLLHASEKILAGEEVKDEESPTVFHPMLKIMRLIMQTTNESEWDWSSPVVQNIYKEIAESPIYKNFADATVAIVTSIIRKVTIKTLVEVGTGPGQITLRLCEEMTKHNISIPIVISDRLPSISTVGGNLRKSFPHLTLDDFVWDFREDPPDELIEKLTKPVLLFERFCIPYGGYESIDKISPIADVLLMVEDLNLTGKKEAYDIIFEKIGTQFFTYKKVKEYLEKYFSFIDTCDSKTIEAINLPGTHFTLAMK